MKRKIKGKKILKAAGRTVSAAFVLFFCMAQRVYASTISESKLAKGTEQLISDATTWLMILAPVVAGLLIIYSTFPA